MVSNFIVVSDRIKWLSQVTFQVTITTQEAMYDQSMLFEWLVIYLMCMFVCVPECMYVWNGSCVGQKILDAFEIESEVIYRLPDDGAGIEPSPLKRQNVLFTIDSTL